MFCLRCYKAPIKAVHRFECPLTSILFFSGLSSSIQMAFRTFFVALSLFDGSVELLEKFLSQNHEQRSVFDIADFSDMKEKLLAVHSLIFSENIEANEDIFKETFQLTPELRSMWSTNGQFIKSLLTKQVQIGSMNYHEIYEWPLKKGGLADDEISELQESLAYKRGVISTGNGSYPFCALINHSCSPNVNRLFIDGRVILIVVRSIEKGEQLFDNYGFNFTLMPKVSRRKQLLAQYKFKCSCQACENDWPLLPSLKIIDRLCFIKAKSTARELSMTGLSYEKVIEKFKELCEILEKGKKTFLRLRCAV